MAPGFRVVAIVAAYNEADIVEQSVADLVEQGVDVYLVDDGSTDGTADIAERYRGRGVVAVERRPPGAAGCHRFSLASIVERKTRIAESLDADWFINHDVDEFRESPWPQVPLRDAIERVDTCGYSAIDFVSLDFWPTDDRFRPGDDVRAAFTHHAAPTPHDRQQIRCWKNTGAAVDLVSTGGHSTGFAGRRVFPIRFLSRHYPIRGQAHGERKVFAERRRDYDEHERAHGWHVQYDGIEPGDSFIRDPATLTPYDGDAVRLELALRHRGVEALEAAVAETRCVIDTQRREIERLHEQLAQLRGRLAGTAQALDQRSAEAAAWHEMLDRTSIELGSMRTRHAAQQDAIERAHAALLDREHAIDGLSGALAGAQARIAALEASRSWRVTSPLRAILRAIRGR
jgi:glycosyltransferase involved in cell wall biosynthesis/uncharacterized coiled-coil protein SlyX